MEVVDFSGHPGILSDWARDLGGVSRPQTSGSVSNEPQGTGRRYLLLAETTGDAPLSWTPEPVRLEIVKGRSRLRYPQRFWPLPRGISPPTFQRWVAANIERDQARVLLAQDKPLEALVRAERLVKLSPMSIGDRLLQIECIEALDVVDPAVLQRSVDDALTLFPTSRPLLVRAARLAQQGSRLDRAFDLYQRAVAAQPDDEESCLALARLEVRRDHPTAAIRFYVKAIDLEPTTPLARL
ncbi:MAG: hypothetical protein P8Z74_19455, partial [Acidobacteriota bacterium]